VNYWVRFKIYFLAKTVALLKLFASKDNRTNWHKKSRTTRVLLFYIRRIL